jgi:hypothetical protein
MELVKQEELKPFQTKEEERKFHESRREDRLSKVTRGAYCVAGFLQGVKKMKPEARVFLDKHDVAEALDGAYRAVAVLEDLQQIVGVPSRR